MHEDFFVLWRDHDGGSQRAWLRGLVVVIFLAAVATASVLVFLQGTVSADARFEFGTTRMYEGVLVGDPVPLLVTRERNYFLVNPLKYGFEAGTLTGSTVRLEATLIERGEQAMLEVVEGSVGPAEGSDTGLLHQEALGRTTLRGEIVDSKCYLGVMNPGHLKPHRACAVNCLRGGIPAVLISRHADGSTSQTVLVGAGGIPVRDWILPYVAEPVEIDGELSRVGDLLVIEVSSTDVRRIGN